MNIESARTEIEKIFTENGFTKWANQARNETDPDLLKLLAVRAVNTAPEAKKENVKTILKTFL